MTHLHKNQTPSMSQINDKAPDLINHLNAAEFNNVATSTHTKNDFKIPLFRNIFKTLSLSKGATNSTFRFKNEVIPIKNEVIPTHTKNVFNIPAIGDLEIVTNVKSLPLRHSLKKGNLKAQKQNTLFKNDQRRLFAINTANKGSVSSFMLKINSAINIDKRGSVSSFMSKINSAADTANKGSVSSFMSKINSATDTTNRGSVSSFMSKINSAADTSNRGPFQVLCRKSIQPSTLATEKNF